MGSAIASAHLAIHAGMARTTGVCCKSCATCGAAVAWIACLIGSSSLQLTTLQDAVTLYLSRLPTSTSAVYSQADTPTGEAASAVVAACQLLRAALQCGYILDDQASICRLLCTSKAIAAAVAEACSGQLAVCLDPPNPEVGFGIASIDTAGSAARGARRSSLAVWIQSNGGLLRELDCRESIYTSVPSGPLHSQPLLIELLPTLPACAPRLAKLFGCIQMITFRSASAARSAANRCSGLTSLTSLHLDFIGAQHKGGPAPFLSVLQQLPNLKDLGLGLTGRGPGFVGVDAAGLQHLPTQLTSLRLGFRLGLHTQDLEVRGVLALILGYWILGYWI